MRTQSIALCVAAAVLVAGCASVPTGPSVMVLPGSSKSFDQFQSDDASCREWALQQTGTTPNRSGAANTVTGAAVGTAVGAALGAAIGAAAGSPATGAAVGAGAGLFGGTAVGAGNASTAQVSTQRRYDMSYMQCMFAKGNQIPVARGAQPSGYAAQPAATQMATPPPPPPPRAAPTPPPGTPPPPPEGTPPPPPPGPTR
jgi:uncharacterized protein YcfJ